MQTFDLFRKPGQIELPDVPIIVAYGGGVDSTAMLIAMKRQGIVPDVITFADVGAEKPETYATVRMMNTWCIDNGFPAITVCRLNTRDSTPYDDIEGNQTANDTLPSIAFGKKGCSVKWKHKPQDYYITGNKGPVNGCEPHPLWIDCQARGIKPAKLIGFDAGPADIRRTNKTEDDKFLYVYPLQQLGWQRQDCIQAILEEGLPVPIKSACFFCPASQKWELWWLAGAHPDLLERALVLEHQAMLGKHSRWGEDECTYGKDWEEFVNKPADQWPTTSITVGLGRSFAWNHWARINGVCDEHGTVIPDPERYLAKAAELKGDGGNASDAGRPCI